MPAKIQIGHTINILEHKHTDNINYSNQTTIGPVEQQPVSTARVARSAHALATPSTSPPVSILSARDLETHGCSA